MVGIFPYAIGASVMSVVALLVYSTNFDLRSYLTRYATTFQRYIDAADLQFPAEDFLLGVAGAGAALWLATVLLMRQNLLISLLAFPAAEAMAVLAGIGYLRLRGTLRLKKFGDQLEMVLRTISGALRVGVGLRQALVIVIEELPNPARKEFRRVIGRTNIGVSLTEAIEEMAKTVPGNEMNMFVKVIKVQSQTGGDLASVLESLAATIRDRRRVVRKMNSLTAQGRMGAAIIGGLPLLVGAFVIFTQPEMGHAMLHTVPGWCILGGVGVLEGLAIFSLLKILQLDV